MYEKLKAARWILDQKRVTRYKQHPIKDEKAELLICLLMQFYSLECKATRLPSVSKISAIKP